MSIFSVALLLCATFGPKCSGTSACPLVRFGLVTDAHSADRPMGPCIPPAGDRYYRESAAKLAEFVEVMNRVKPEFVIELGDLKDLGKDQAETMENLRRIEGVFAGFRGPRYHVLGNHDTDLLTKDEFLSVAKNEGCTGSYYSFARNGVTFVVLDACFKSDLTPYSRENPWDDANVPTEELAWLERTLAAADGPVIAFCHQRLDPASEPAHLVRNAYEVRTVLERSGKVKAVFSGHQHFGGESDLNGIWYYTLKALVVGGAAENAYALASVFADGRVAVEGYHKVSDSGYAAALAVDETLRADGLSVNGKTVTAVERRAFADGYAVRYRLPSGPRRIGAERTSWTLPLDARIWFQRGSTGKDGGYAINYESPYETSLVRDLGPGTPLAFPVTAALADGSYRLLTEANVVDWTDSAVVYRGDGRFEIDAYCDRGGFDQEGSDTSPWRVCLVARDLQTLATSDIVRRLCPVPTAHVAFGCSKFVRPGRCIWQWLPAGDPEYGEQKDWYDRTKALGFEYYLVDDGWKRWRDGDKDQWACLKKWIDYGKSIGVETFMWVDSKEMPDATSRRAYLDKVVATGAVGIKIDFIPAPTCVFSTWYEETLGDTYDRKLMVDFHGAVKPTGRERTWPHEVAREAIRGHEWHITRYKRILAPEHDCILPFSRLVQGHADYTPVVFEPKELQGMSRVRELAQGVIFAAPFLCFGDYPRNYQESPAADFVRSLPAVYDETRVLDGSEIGSCVAVAKRSGTTWFVAVENASAPRTLDIPLGFLGEGKWEMAGFESDPDDILTLRPRTGTVDAATRLHVEIPPCGGFVARLKTDAKESLSDYVHCFNAGDGQYHRGARRPEREVRAQPLSGDAMNWDSDVQARKVKHEQRNKT